MDTKVIVFGPTGNIGSFCARTAQEHGAKVYLAMRDTSKPIPGLTQQQEANGSFERIYADLTIPNTVATAVKTSGAKHAFVYVAHASQDAMKGTIRAMKDSGITFVVLLSSFTIDPDTPLYDIPKSESVPYVHAQVEMSLEEIYGPDRSHFIALRPGSFATNSLRYIPGIKAGEVQMYGRSSKMDCITPGDIGRVAGTILASGVKDSDERIIYLYGPRLWRQDDMVRAIGNIIGKEVKVIGQTAEEATAMWEKLGFPKPIIEYGIRRLGDNEEEAVPRPRYREGVQNVQKYTGRQAQTFEEWVREDMSKFTA